MNMMTSNQLYEKQNWRPWFCAAKYQPQLVTSYKGNPLIEALPPILLADEASAALANYPLFDPDSRTLPSEIRFHEVMDILDLFEPLDRHLELEQRFSRAIRRGYVARNPLLPGHYQQLGGNVETLKENMQMYDAEYRQYNSVAPTNIPSTTFGFGLLGIGGTGKTTAIRRIMSLYPQVIIHSEYCHQPLVLAQVVWLKLDCPNDGSVKGLCINFFTMVDDLLGVNYSKHYAKNGRATVDQMLPHMARVASLHKIGVLIIDELQHLSEAKSGGAAKMLNFFVQLVNIIGLPVILVGTSKAKPLLTKEFRQIRRNSGLGNPLWENLKNDEDWEHFLQALWRYQYIQKPAELTDELSQVLYYETQGIIDFAVKIFILSQIRAIVTGIETLTPSIIHSSAADALILAKPALDALRKGDKTALMEFEDIEVIDLEPLVEQYQAQLHTSEGKANSKAASRPTDSAASPTSDKQRVDLPDDLRHHTSDDDISAHQALLESDLIKPATEFLD